MLPLIQGTVENVKELGTTRALTGPISRGDIGTVREHLTGLGLKNPNYLGLYRQLGLYTVGVAANKGSITSQEADELMQILKEDLR